MIPQLKIVARTGNRKLTDGKTHVAATMRPVGPTCPSECRFLNHGCYAQKGMVRIHQARATKVSGDLQALMATDTRLIRHHVSGDFFLDNRLDTDYLNEVIEFHRANPDMQGWAYTHGWRRISDAGYDPKRLPKNFALIASVDSRVEMREAQALGWRTASVANDWSERIDGDVKCPAQLSDNRTVCSNCRLCWNPHPRIKNILFKKH